LINNFQRVYVPDREISIDESLLKYKGRLSWKQYIASKRARFGVKFFTLCESKSGYIWNSIIYTGKDTLIDNKYAQYGLSTSSVLSLVDPLLDKGYCVVMDNFYSSPELFNVLLSRSTDAYGTVRPNRKGMPSEMKRKKINAGEMIAWRKDKLLAFKWKDKRDVHILSTVHGSTMDQLRSRTNEEVVKPSAVVSYNMSMGGVDHADQSMTYYPVVRKQQKKYYIKIFRHLLEQSLWNSFVLYNQRREKKVTHAYFILELVEKLFTTFQLEREGQRTGRRPPIRGNPQRLVERHFMDLCPPTRKKTCPTRRCVVCCSKLDGSKQKIRKETRFYCPDCDVGLCAIPCFRIYHTKTNYWSSE
jgi:Transposase IS4/DDE_Tnp_1-like zinc-ribbon